MRRATFAPCCSSPSGARDRRTCARRCPRSAAGRRRGQSRTGGRRRGGDRHRTHDLLRELTLDRLHEPYRAHVYPELPRLTTPLATPVRSAPACPAPARRSSRSPTRSRRSRGSKRHSGGRRRHGSARTRGRGGTPEYRRARGRIAPDRRSDAPGKRSGAPPPAADRTAPALTRRGHSRHGRLGARRSGRGITSLVATAFDVIGGRCGRCTRSSSGRCPVGGCSSWRSSVSPAQRGCSPSADRGRSRLRSRPRLSRPRRSHSSSARRSPPWAGGVHARSA